MLKNGYRERSDLSKVDCNDYDEETGEVINRTRQEFRQECDLNWIISRYTPEALIESYNSFKGHFGDYSEVPDYGVARERVKELNAWFDSLPAKIRRKFNHSVCECVDFLEDRANFDEAVSLGLLEEANVDKASSLSNVPPDVSLDVTGGTGPVLEA